MQAKTRQCEASVDHVGGATIRPSRPASVVLWEGASALDGAPIVVIATGLQRKSRNAKTGAMVQTFILRADVHPVDALKSGADASICGACPHRPQEGPEGAVTRSCYVDVAKSVAAVWKAYKAGSYPRVNAFEAAALLAGRKVRLGAYGDPAAAPFAMWSVATSQAAGVTGYSHQWRSCDQRFAKLAMASCDSAQDRAAAAAAGWRTFRVRSAGEALGELEFICPASAEKSVTNCATCMSCGGTSKGAKASPVIIAHGAGARHIRHAA